MRNAKCRSCQAPVVWAKSENGKNVLFNAAPEGEQRGYRIDPDGVARWTVSPPAGTKLYVSHWATCPNAAQHRTEARKEAR